MKHKNQIYEDIKYMDFTALKILLSVLAIVVAWVMNEARISPLTKITPAVAQESVMSQIAAVETDTDTAIK